MITHILRLTKWEWFKLRRRWMPWILLAIVVLFSQLGIWVSYAVYHNETVRELLGSNTSYQQFWEEDGRTKSVEVTCEDVANDRLPDDLHLLSEDEQQDFLKNVETWYDDACYGTQNIEDFREAFVLPSSVTGAIAGVSVIGPILIMVLAASAMGSEYGWGTLRNVLTRGTGRWQLLSAKLLLLLLLCAAAFVVMSLLAAISTVVAAVIPPDELGGLADSGQWSDVAITFAKTLYALAPFIAFSVFFTVLTTSSAIGISISIGYYVAEALILTPIVAFTEWLDTVGDYLLVQSVNNWTAASLVEAERTVDGVPVDQVADPLHAFLVILAYVIILCAATFYLFMRRDIAGARGD